MTTTTPTSEGTSPNNSSTNVETEADRHAARAALGFERDLGLAETMQEATLQKHSLRSLELRYSQVQLNETNDNINSMEKTASAPSGAASANDNQYHDYNDRSQNVQQQSEAKKKMTKLKQMKVPPPPRKQQPTLFTNQSYINSTSSAESKLTKKTRTNNEQRSPGSVQAYKDRYLMATTTSPNSTSSSSVSPKHNYNRFSKRRQSGGTATWGRRLLRLLKYLITLLSKWMLALTILLLALLMGKSGEHCAASTQLRAKSNLWTVLTSRSGLECVRDQMKQDELVLALGATVTKLYKDTSVVVARQSQVAKETLKLQLCSVSTTFSNGGHFAMEQQRRWLLRTWQSTEMLIRDHCRRIVAKVTMVISGPRLKDCLHDDHQETSSTSSIIKATEIATPFVDIVAAYQEQEKNRAASFYNYDLRVPVNKHSNKRLFWRKKQHQPSSSEETETTTNLERTLFHTIHGVLTDSECRGIVQRANDFGIKSPSTSETTAGTYITDDDVGDDKKMDDTTTGDDELLLKKDDNGTTNMTMTIFEVDDDAFAKQLFARIRHALPTTLHVWGSDDGDDDKNANDASGETTSSSSMAYGIHAISSHVQVRRYQGHDTSITNDDTASSTTTNNSHNMTSCFSILVNLNGASADDSDHDGDNEKSRIVLRQRQQDDDGVDDKVLVQLAHHPRMGQALVISHHRVAYEWTLPARSSSSVEGRDSEQYHHVLYLHLLCRPQKQQE